MDFDPALHHLPLPAVDPGTHVFYVVPPNHLDELRSLVPEAEGSILLKPVTRVVFDLTGDVTFGVAPAGPATNDLTIAVAPAVTPSPLAAAARPTRPTTRRPAWRSRTVVCTRTSNVCSRGS